LLLIALAAWHIRRFQKLLRCARPASREDRDLVHDLAKRLGLSRCPDLLLVPGTVSPMLWALGTKARLYVPAVLWQTLDTRQRAALLVHELAHWRRRDHWVRILELFSTSLYWWHPVVWWARRELREAEEQCCDAWVVWALPGSAETYASALIEAVSYLSRARSALPLAASGIGHMQLLKRRLTMIMHGTTPR